jgi:CHAT domain-containing protein
LADPALAADPQPSLHDRIDLADHSAITLDPAADLARYEALKREADGHPELPAEDRATVERLFGMGLIRLDRLDEATSANERGMAILRQAGLEQSGDMGQMLEQRAAIESERSHPDAGLKLALQALAIETAAYGENSPDLFTVENTLADLSADLGRLTDSIDYLRRALGHGAPRPWDQTNHVAATSALSTYLARRGDDDEALKYRFLSLEEARKYLPDGHRGWGVIYTNLATNLAAQDRLEEARAIAAEAVDYNRTHYGRDNFDTGASLRALGNILWRQGRSEEAEAVLGETVAILSARNARSENAYVEADAHRTLSRIAMSRGNYAAAQTRLLLALESLARNKDQSGFSANINSTLAEARLGLKDYAGALEVADKAVAAFRAKLPAYAGERVNAEMLRALILARLGRTAEAWDAAGPLGQMMTARLADVHFGQRARTVVALDYRRNFARLADVALAGGRQEDSFRAAQLASFSEISASSMALAAQAAGRDSGAGQTARAVQDLQVAIDHLDRERSFAVGRSADEVTALDQRIRLANAQLDTALATLTRTFPRYAELTSPTPVSPASIQASLRKDAALLLPVQSDDRLITLLLTRQGLSTATAPLDSNGAARAIASLRASVADGGNSGFDTAAAWTLGRAVFSQAVMARLRGTREIDVVGSGPIMTLPFGMLFTAAPQDGGDAQALRRQPYAIRRFAFAVQPALLTPDSHGAVSSNAFLGIGAPDLGPERTDRRGTPVNAAGIMRDGIADAASLRALPSLPRAGQELVAMQHALPQGRSLLLTGPTATEQGFRSAPLDAFGLLAFATHGLISGEMRGLHEPALVLTPPQDTEKATSDNDGLLTASEIATLKLKARWVILSACNTGAGSENGAGGYSGLARGFLQAGAQNLLVSLWPVRDDVAARLSVDTVRLNARGIRQPAALRAAILRLIDDPAVPDGANPAVWAPFSLVVQP